MFSSIQKEITALAKESAAYEKSLGLLKKFRMCGCWCSIRPGAPGQGGGVMGINVQTAVDNLIKSRKQNWSSPKDVATLLAWAEVDGWDGCLKAWETSGELVVVDWDAFCGEFANDQSVEECEGLAPEELTDNDRVAHLQARLSDSLQDPDEGRS